MYPNATCCEALEPRCEARCHMSKAKPKAPKAARAAPRTPLLALLVAAIAIAAAAYYGLRSGDVPEQTPGTIVETDCLPDDYGGEGAVPCRPTRCGRLVLDDFIDAAHAEQLRALAARGMSLGGGAGGPTILDFASGALSLGENFVDVWTTLNQTGRPFTREELAPFSTLTERIRAKVTETFGAQKLWLAAPTFFSKIAADRPPRIENDEYWHPHVDTLQYGSFTYTALLYLSSAGADFDGGRLRFLRRGTNESVAAVRPAVGRLVLFSSGREHPHHVEPVRSGERLAVTVAFTCERRAAVQDFLAKAEDG